MLGGWGEEGVGADVGWERGREGAARGDVDAEVGENIVPE